MNLQTQLFTGNVITYCHSLGFEKTFLGINGKGCAPFHNIKEIIPIPFPKQSNVIKHYNETENTTPIIVPEDLKKALKGIEKREKAIIEKARSKEEYAIETDYVSEKSALDMYIKETKKYKLLTPEEEMDLGTKIRNNNDTDALQRFVLGNLRLVLKIAHSFLWRGVDMEDLIQEGNLGLFKALEKFDPTLGFKFSTYATWWIEQSMHRAIADYGSTVRKPVHISEETNKVRKATNALYNVLERDPLIQEIADHAEMPVEKVQWVLRTKYEVGNIRSLDDLLGSTSEDSDMTLSDLISDRSDRNPQLILEAKEAKELLEEVVEQLLSELDNLNLPERDYDIFKKYHGLTGEEKMTLEEIGDSLQISRERVRQINESVWKKLQAKNVNLDRKLLTNCILSIHETSALAGIETNVFSGNIQGYVKTPINFAHSTKNITFGPMELLRLICSIYKIDLNLLLNTERWNDERYQQVRNIATYLLQTDFIMPYNEARSFFVNFSKINPFEKTKQTLEKDDRLRQEVEDIRKAYKHLLKSREVKVADSGTFNPCVEPYAKVKGSSKDGDTFKEILSEDKIDEAKEILIDIDGRLAKVSETLSIVSDRQKELFMSKYYQNGNPRKVLSLEEVGKLHRNVKEKQISQLITAAWFAIKQNDKVSYKNLKEFEEDINSYTRWKNLIFRSEMTILSKRE